LAPARPGLSLTAISYRLRSDFQLAIVTLLGSIALLGISPFAVLRALHGEWLAFFVDLLIIAGILGSMLHAWRSGNTHGPSLFLAYFIGVMAIVAIYVLGPAGEFWFYPAMVANFFLVDRRHALSIALAGLGVGLLRGHVAAPIAEAASFAVTTTVCALLSYAFAYRSAVQREQLETLATKDELTGIHNRRALMEELERSRRNFLREGRRYGLLVLDLDHFKEINDQYGHLTGDRVLARLARLLEQGIRQGDRAFRFGGEEFVILTHSASRTNLEAMAEKLRRKVESEMGTDIGITITTSVGGALLTGEDSTSAWFAKADEALYRAKETGRNRTLIASGE
jgi:diguanylate cyclase (GGDEF)-like protein